RPADARQQAGGSEDSQVVNRHGRAKARSASSRLDVPAIHVFLPSHDKDVDARDPSPPRLRRGHERTRPAEALAKAASPGMTKKSSRALSASPRTVRHKGRASSSPDGASHDDLRRYCSRFE